jgi:hypothetical protein
MPHLHHPLKGLEVSREIHEEILGGFRDWEKLKKVPKTAPKWNVSEEKQMGIVPYPLPALVFASGKRERK